MYQDFLPLVSKPARYINTEINCARKDLGKVKTKVCLFFPDTYEVGMSHIGLRVLYHILNSREDTACERVFSPWTDYEARLRASGRPLASLESNVPLSEFDIIGVTLQYELSYTNVLAGLDMGGIPIRSNERTDRHPVVIAGGPCAVNPGPLSGFIDAFFIGEAEEAVHEIVELRQRHAGRDSYLRALAEREGFYIPALGKKSVSRRVIGDLESAPWPSKPILPLMKPVHDRVAVEIARGCIRGCRYCQAGIIYRPYRERSAALIKDVIRDSLLCTGYDEISLASLSSGDHSEIQALVTGLIGTYKDGRISVSLPSLRVGTLTPEMVDAISHVRKTGFTLAPEAGTERLRSVINKPLSELDLIDAAETIFKSGWSVLKLYFMIGLPTETQEDVDSIINLGRELLALGKRVSKRHVQLNITVSTFVPKPHTPFQWLGQAPFDEIREKQAHLERGLRRRGISLKPHDPEMSLLEAAFARGDASLSNVIEKAYRLGCRFDGWGECFDFTRWGRAFQECGTGPDAYACREYGLDEPLPWDNIETGVTSEFLKIEYKKALSAETTENCRVECSACGMGCSEGGSTDFGKPAAKIQTMPKEVPLRGPISSVKHPAGQEPVIRIRIKHTKTGRIRFLSHLDFMTLFQRAVIRAGAPVAFSGGFNPHPKIAFGPALSVGMESEAEYLDMEADPFIDILETVKGLNNTLPAGVRILEAKLVPKKAASLSAGILRYMYEVEAPEDHAEGIEKKVVNFLSLPSIIVSKDGKQKDIRSGIESITVKPGEKTLIEIIIRDKEDVRPRAQDIIETLFNVPPDRAVLFPVKRTAQYINIDGRWQDPMEAS